MKFIYQGITEKNKITDWKTEVCAWKKKKNPKSKELSEVLKLVEIKLMNKVSKLSLPIRMESMDIDIDILEVGEG